MKAKHKKRVKAIFSHKKAFRIKPLTKNTLFSGILNILLLGIGFLYISWTFQKDYLRSINFAMLPKPGHKDSGVFKALHFGQLAVIIDGEGLFYIHERDDYILKKYNSQWEEINGLTGLNADCLEFLNTKELVARINCLRENSTILNGPVISFSLTKEASFDDMIRFLDLMTHIKAMKYVWTKITKEEIKALKEKKKEPLIRYVSPE